MVVSIAGFSFMQLAGGRFFYIVLGECTRGTRSRNFRNFVDLAGVDRAYQLA